MGINHVQPGQRRHVERYADEKPRPEGLLLRFMAKALLAEDGPGQPPAVPSTSSVVSGTRRRALRAASLSAP